jgi:hypothetical protein
MNLEDYSQVMFSEVAAMDRARFEV